MNEVMHDMMVNPFVDTRHDSTKHKLEWLDGSGLNREDMDYAE